MLVVDIAAVVVRLAIGVWLFWSLRTVAVSARSTAGWTVLVPARDEAANLRRLLPTIPAGVPTIVVDDGSTDATAAVAADLGASVVTAPEPPAGWTGKTWACATGLTEVATPNVCVVDADVRFAPGGFAGVVEAADGVDLLSVQPYHEAETPTERLAALFNVVSLAGTDVASPRPPTGAFGPVLATSVATLGSVGGFDAVRTEVVEDVALAERYRSAGLDVDVRGGGEAVVFRMYPGGFTDMVEGFTKNLVSGLGRIRRSTAGLVVAWSTLLVQSTVTLVRVPIDADPWWAVGLYLVTSAQVWWMARRVGRFGPLTALAHPVLIVVFLAVFVRSLAARASGTVTWRGRRIDV